MNLAELKQKSLDELSTLAGELNIDGATGMRRQELIFSILRAKNDRRTEIHADGVLEVLPDGFGFLRAAEANYLPGPEDIYVSPSQIRRFNMHTGDTVHGVVRPPKESERYFALLRVVKVNSLSPDEQRNKVPFEELTAVHPDEKLNLEIGADRTTVRAVDLLSPIAKGQRCLIAAPERAGKTTLLRDFARALAKHHPEIKVTMLLLDARPEEVTEMSRAVDAEIAHSTFDELPSRHTQLAEIVLERGKRMAEAGGDVAIVVDSLTALTKAYHAVQPPSERELCPGLDLAALQAPKRFFGAARKLESGGSLTILATALRDTGEAVDEAILAQFRAGANSEIWFNRHLVDQRIYPAIDVHRTITRHDDVMLPPTALEARHALRDQLVDLSLEEAAAELKKRLAEFPTNQKLLAAAKSA